MIKRWLQLICPVPRKAVTWHALVSPVLFIAVFVALWFGLSYFDVLLFTRPWALALLLLVPWIWWMNFAGYSGLAGWRGAVALWVRLILFAVFVVLLADPRSVRKHQQLSVVFAVDLSASVAQQASQQALEYVSKIVSEKPSKDEVGLIVFAQDAAVELPPAVTFPFEAVSLQVHRDGTNLERALALSQAVLPEESQSRIVLISDGVQTDGNLLSVLDQLKSRDVAVDVLPVTYEYEHEVWVERLELPRFTKVGETYEAAAIVSSLKAGEGELVLLENGREIYRQPVKYGAGKSRVSVPLYLRTAGYYEYTAVLEVPEDEQGKVADGWKNNNRAVNYLYLQGEGRVLLVIDPAAEDERDWQPLAQSLRKAKRQVDVMTGYELPHDAMALLPYDCIILVNAPAESMVASQMQAIRNATFNQGSGLLMVGGANSFGPGGYHRSVIEEALPVTMDITQRKVLPKGALAIILHTCEFANGNTIGKEITKQAIRVLGAQDDAGVMAYDYQKGDYWVFPMTPASEYEKMVKLINNASLGDMPSFVGSMQMGLNALKNNDAATKHMIIISDGDPSPPPTGVLQQFRQEGISVSTIAVFPHGTDVGLMKKIALATGGRFYYPQDVAQLPQIFIKEAKTLKRSMIQNKTFTPTKEFPSPVLKGIGTMPELRGYVLTTAKNRAITVLRGPDTEQLDPVLATWNFGVGKAGAFTSDLSSNWAANWMRTDSYDVFVKQLVTELSRTNAPSSLRMQTFAEGNTGVIHVEDYAQDAGFLDMQASVITPDNQRLSVQLTQVGPRRYQGTFPLPGEGRYQVNVTGTGGDREERATGGFALPYSQEYLRFRSDPMMLKEVAQRTGGRMLTGSETGAEVFGVPRETRTSSKSIADWLLVLLACLIPLDVAVRRVQIDWAQVRKYMGIGRRAAPSEKTFDALRKRKATLATTPSAKSGARTGQTEVASRPMAAVDEPAFAPPKVKPKPQAAPPSDKDSAPKPPASDDASTTSRLLALKRKRNTDDDQPGSPR